MKVVTWETTSGQRVDICSECTESMTEQGVWVWLAGEQACSVYMGAHRGECGICGAGKRVEPSDIESVWRLPDYEFESVCSEAQRQYDAGQAERRATVLAAWAR